MDIRTSYLIGKKLTGEISASEMHELNEMIQADSTLFNKIEKLEYNFLNNEPFDQSIPNITRLISKLQKEEPGSFEDELPSLIFNPIPKSKKKFKRRKITWFAAASIVILVGIGTLISLLGEHQETQLEHAEVVKKSNVILTKPGSQTNIVLQDGTKVWLNADSKLTYNDNFNQQTREVNLTGEAFFEVAKNPGKPFIIHTSKINIKVTGTSFNVRSYPDEKKVETALIHGKVEISLLSNPKKIFYLRPKEKLVLKDDENDDFKYDLINKIPIAPVPEIVSINYNALDSIPVETAWVNSQLAFNDESFREVAYKMEKWYGVKIIFNTEDLEEIRFTGKFESESLQEALQALQIIGKFNFSVNQKTVIISNQKNNRL